MHIKHRYIKTITPFFVKNNPLVENLTLLVIYDLFTFGVLKMIRLVQSEHDGEI